MNILQGLGRENEDDIAQGQSRGQDREKRKNNILVHMIGEKVTQGLSPDRGLETRKDVIQGQSQEKGESTSQGQSQERGRNIGQGQSRERRKSRGRVRQTYKSNCQSPERILPNQKNLNLKLTLPNQLTFQKRKLKRLKQSLKRINTVDIPLRNNYRTPGPDT